MLKQVLLKFSYTLTFLFFSIWRSSAIPRAQVYDIKNRQLSAVPFIGQHFGQLGSLGEPDQKERHPSLRTPNLSKLQSGWNGWNMNVIKLKDNEVLPKSNAEPGFDFTDDEMKKFKLWPKGIVPYYIDVYSYRDKVLRDKIRWYLYIVNSLSNLNFMELPSPPKDDTTRWVFFLNRRGLLSCADHSIKNFTNEGVQQVVIGYECLNTGEELAQAVLAIAGVPPQHNAPDRDDYIIIKDENIQPDKKYLFEKLEDNEWLFHDMGYDFFSAGHFHYHKHSINGRATIKTQPKYFDTSIGETNGLSLVDIWKLRMLYNYIGKKKEDTLADCNKLFDRGTKFDQYRPHYPANEPRQKPNKYLGLPEEINDSKNRVEANSYGEAEPDIGCSKNDEDCDERIKIDEGSENSEGSKNGEGSQNDDGGKNGEGSENDEGGKNGDGSENDEGGKHGEASENDEGIINGKGSENDEGGKNGEGSENDEGNKNGKGSENDEGSKNGEGSENDGGGKNGEGSENDEGNKIDKGSENDEGSKHGEGSENNEDNDKFNDPSNAASNEVTPPLYRPSDIQMLMKPTKFSDKRDPLSYLSDYNTGDDNYAKNAYKNVGIQYIKFEIPSKIRRTRK